MRVFLGGVIVAIVLGTISQAQGGIFTNGSFEAGNYTSVSNFQTLTAGETSIDGWTVTGDGIDWISGYWAAASGIRSLDLNATSPGGISQTFDTIPGQEYAVSFDMAGNPDGAPVDKTLNVSAGLVTQSYHFDITGKNRFTVAGMGWETHVFTFQATGTSSTLTFTSTTTGDSGDAQYPHAFGAALDNITVAALPEPASATLWAALGLGGLVVGRMRRRR